MLKHFGLNSPVVEQDIHSLTNSIPFKSRLIHRACTHTVANDKLKGKGEVSSYATIYQHFSGKTQQFS